MTDGQVDRVTGILLQKPNQSGGQEAFVDGIGGADTESRPGKGGGIQFQDGAFLQIQDTPGIILKEQAPPG